MSQWLTSPSFEMLMITGRGIALVLGLLLFAWAFRHWRRTAIRDTQRVFEQLDLVRSELLIMREAMHHSTNRPERSARIGVPEPRVPTPAIVSGPRGYEMAARMARNGASKEDLIRSCGVTAHEAELLVKLHGFRRDTKVETQGAAERGTQTQTAANGKGTYANDAAALIGRQARPAATQDSGRQIDFGVRQPAAARQGSAGAAEAQRAQAARSRLVAVG